MVSNTELNKIQRLQDTCVSLIKNPKCTQKILCVRDIVKLENLKFAYKLMNSILPIKVCNAALSDHKGNSLKKSHRYSTRNKSIPNTPANVSSNYLNSVLCKSLLEYRTLEVETRELKSYTSFVSHWKKLLRS